MELKDAALKSARSILNMLPMMFGILLIISLLNTAIPKSAYTAVFSGNLYLDPVIGGAFGSVLVGNPVTSYIIGGEMLAQGTSLVAVTAFIVAWVSVGMVSLPVEASMLGKRFAVLRNLLSFVFSIIVAITAVFLVGVL